MQQTGSLLRCNKYRYRECGARGFLVKKCRTSNFSGLGHNLYAETAGCDILFADIRLCACEVGSGCCAYITGGYCDGEKTGVCGQAVQRASQSGSDSGLKGWATK